MYRFQPSRLFGLTILLAALPVAAFHAHPTSAAAGVTPTLVSAANPYSTCTIGGNTGVTTTVNYPNAEVEPWVTVNPTNSANIVGVWQQDRWNDGGAHGLVAGYSFDGGRAWGETPLPFSACAPNTPINLRYERASDPWVSFGPDGTAYANGLTFDVSDANNGVAAATSSDGGRTWTNAQPLIADTNPNISDDKNSVTADPTRVGYAYSVWDRLDFSPVIGSGSANRIRPDAIGHGAHGRRRLRSQISSAASNNGFTGPTWFSRTTDGGKTWSTARIIVPTAQNAQTIGNIIVVDPRNDTLYDVFTYYTDITQNSATANIAVVTSTDQGLTWSGPHIVAPLNEYGQADPNNPNLFLRSGGLPEAAIDPKTGALYVVWEGNFDNNHYDEVALSTSADGGVTWTTPKRINTPYGGPAFLPSIAVDDAGIVGVTYYDFRTLQPGNTTTLPTDIWFISSSDGGATFGHETHISGAFDFLTAPQAGGYFVGDYEGLAPIGATFLSFFVQTNSGDTANRTDVFSASVPAPTGGTGGGMATPELGSGELLATGLAPVLAALLYRRRRRARANVS